MKWGIIMRKLVMLLLILLGLCLCAGAQGEGILTLDELLGWAEGYQDIAQGAAPLNNPADRDAASEEGVAFVYDFATLYLDSTEAKSGLRGLVIVDPAQYGPHMTRCGMSAEEVMACFRNDNAALIGSHGQAILYLVDRKEDGVWWGQLNRDGQRIDEIFYCALAPLGDGLYSDAGVAYTLTDGVVTAIRAWGLDASIEGPQAQASAQQAALILADESWRPAPVSLNGLELTAFGAGDLSFSGLHFPDTSPEQAAGVLGSYTESYMEDGDNYLRVMTFAKCELTYVCDSRKRNPVLTMLQITGAGLEGPRAVRIGDEMNSVITRFRFGEGEYNGTTEVLYGITGEVPFGVAEYSGKGAAVLRYAMAAEDGGSIVLVISFAGGAVDEILLYQAQ